MKLALKNKVRSLLSVFVGFFPIKRDTIIFESIPELSGSPWAIYQEMLKRGFGKKYRLIWAVDESFCCSEGVRYTRFFGKVPVVKKFLHRICLCRAKAIVENNRFVYKVNSCTFRLHAQHGAPLKNASSYNKQIGNLDAILSLSENTVALEQKIFQLPKDKFVTLGYPSNDNLFKELDLYEIGFIKQLTGSSLRFNKIIGWLPTFRQHKSGGANSDHVFPYGVPLLQTNVDFETLNRNLKEKNILLVIQVHHAQVQNFPVQTYSNIVILSPELKRQFGVSTANLMHSFDALITDYSGAYHEYLLLDRPVALSIDDYEEYAKNPGFSIDYFDWIKGVYLKNVADFMKFIDDVANGIDSAKKERESAMHRIHKYIDDHSTQRVVNYLVEKANL